MKKYWIVIVGVLVLAGTTTFADEASQRKAALKLLEVTNSQKILDQMMASMEQMMTSQFKAMNLPPEGREAAEEARKESLAMLRDILSWEQMRDLYVDIYSEVFTEGELNQLVEFYQSPLGARLLEKMPEVMQKSMQKTQAVMMTKMPEFQKRMEAKMAELQKKYPK